ncbi:Aspartate--tRNA(Asp/Asn) ligase, partial [termite gut metagenome]
MLRTHTCGELRLSDIHKEVTLSGWVQRSRKMGGMTFIDLRDRYGITQLVFNEEINAPLCEQANKLGREYVIQIKGTVNERFNKNANLPTGDVEIIVSALNVLNVAATPPFTIEDNTDGVTSLCMSERRNSPQVCVLSMYWCYLVTTFSIFPFQAPAEVCTCLSGSRVICSSLPVSRSVAVHVSNSGNPKASNAWAGIVMPTSTDRSSKFART